MQEESKQELKVMGKEELQNALEHLVKIAEIEIVASANKYDDMLLIALPLIKSKIEEALAKI